MQGITIYATGFVCVGKESLQYDLGGEDLLDVISYEDPGSSETAWLTRK